MRFRSLVNVQSVLEQEINRISRWRSRDDQKAVTPEERFPEVHISISCDKSFHDEQGPVDGATHCAGSAPVSAIVVAKHMI